MKHEFTPFPILCTNRLKLRKLEIKDEDTLFEYQSNKDNFTFVEMPVYTSIEQTKKYTVVMNQGVDKNTWIHWAISLIDTDEIIGTMSIWNLDHDENKAELGYGIFPKYRRKGYMQETIEAILNYGFNEMDLDTIEAYTSHLNKPSQALLINNSFSFITTIIDEYSNGALMDLYKITKEQD